MAPPPRLVPPARRAALLGALRLLPALGAVLALLAVPAFLPGPAAVPSAAAAAPPAGAPERAPADAPVPGARPPLPPPLRVLAPFVAPATRYGPGHRGVDLGAAVGTPVRAAGAGTVVAAGPVAGRGVVSVQHPTGWRTTYEPVAAAVSPGQPVAAGEALGTLRPGHGSCVPACLHWGLRRGDAEYRDPLLLLDPRLLDPGPARLLPLGRGGVSGVLERTRHGSDSSSAAQRGPADDGWPTAWSTGTRWAAGVGAGGALVAGLHLVHSSGRERQRQAAATAARRAAARARHPSAGSWADDAWADTADGAAEDLATDDLLTDDAGTRDVVDLASERYRRRADLDAPW